ncbi:MAG: UDP-galactopyranose mutase [Methanobrevibacter sp.]|jgi:UDP-galactopyranose mutase|nr:UDP-galactopyranose mutase [Candidatus Methanovirga basalitermitum]
MFKYDYLVVGSGLFGSIFAHEMSKAYRKVLIIEKRNHIAGNIYTYELENINVHKYGPHIFHTNDKEVWDYLHRFAEFNRYTNSPVAIYKKELYNLPFNMNTFYQMWKIKTPNEAKNIIEKQKNMLKNPKNLEEQAIKLVGEDIYEKLIKGYTEKQWGKPCSELPPFIINRLPVRFTYDNNYFNDQYQGIPIGGYTKIIEKLLKNVEVKLNTNFFDNRENMEKLANKIVYTGMIDQFYDYCFGELEYRSLKFESETKNLENYQGNAVVNYTEAEIDYTRIIEHKHFENTKTSKTIITHEYPTKYKKGEEAYYPVNDDKNSKIWKKYNELAENEKNVIFGGRLAKYKYYDMWEVIKEALKVAEDELSNVR